MLPTTDSPSKDPQSPVMAIEGSHAHLGSMLALQLDQELGGLSPFTSLCQRLPSIANLVRD